MNLNELNVFLLQNMSVEMNLYFPIGNELCGSSIVVLDDRKF